MLSTELAGDPAHDGGTRGRIAWAFYDWANSPYTTLIITFVFSAYFSQGIVGDHERGTQLWGYTTGLSGLLIAILSPILGAVADAGGPRKPWLLVFTLVCAAGACCLWFATPSPSAATWAMTWVVIATVGFEFGIVFSNAMLPDICPLDRVGRWSGWAWGLGYFGGLAALIVALVGFVQTDHPWLGLDKNAAEHVRIVGPLVAIWLVVFAWPLFVFTPDRPQATIGLRRQITAGLSTLRSTLSSLGTHRNIVIFLVARMLYTDGLATVFAFGGIFAAGTFGMDMAQVITFGIVLNVTAGIGAVAFGWVDDRLGARRTIAIALICLILSAAGAVMARDVRMFWLCGSVLGIFVGPAQAASRSMMARLAPRELSTEFFGLYALSGKATTFAGPILVGSITAATGSQRYGMAVVLAFLLAGLGLLTFVKEESQAK